jgi:hypothetical protein
MQTATDLNRLIISYNAALPNLNLLGDEREEYSVVLSWLEKLIKDGAPKERVVRECVDYLDEKIVKAMPTSV